MRLKFLLCSAVFAMPLGMGAVQAQEPVEITFTRSFGTCTDEFGDVTDLDQAYGECGLITALVNNYNATNDDNVRVNVQVMPFRTYYDQLSAMLTTGDIPTVSLMHGQVIGDYVRRGLVQPLNEVLAGAGVDTADYTAHARRDAIIEDTVYALPISTVGWLWHYNVDLMEEAGLVDENGEVIEPTSVEELFAFAEQFREATGKPYLSTTSVGGGSNPGRVFYSLMLQQGNPIVNPDTLREMTVDSEEGRAALELTQQLYAQGHIAQQLDSGQGIQALISGEVGVAMEGTHLTDTFARQAESGEAALKNYISLPFPTLFETPASYADTHLLVMLEGGATTDREREAAQSFLNYMWEHNLEWSRTGHLPGRLSVLQSEEFLAMPGRDRLTEIADTGAGLPQGTQFQFGLLDVIAAEAMAGLAGKDIDTTLADMERRGNDILARSR